MVMHWGKWTSGYSNNFRVGIDLTVSGTTISAHYRIEAQYVANDSMTLRRSGAIGGSTDFRYNQSGGVRNIVRLTRSGSRGKSYGFSASVSGIYNGASPSISDARITVPALAPSKPATPTTSSVTSSSWKGTVTAPSSNGASITQYQWQRATNSSFSSGTGSATTTGRTYTFSGRSANTTYYYRVRARNSAGWSSWSNGRSVTTKPLAPNAPSNVKASRSSDTRQNISWSRNQTSARPYSGQSVRRRDNVSTSWTTIGNVSGTATSLQDNNTRSNRRYEYSVRANNSAGNSSWSSSAVVTTTPAAPSNVKAVKSGNDVVVSWTRNTTHSSTGNQEIQDNPGGNGWVTVGSVSRTATSWTHSNPDPAVTHQYRVRASTTTPTLWSSYGTSGVVQLQAPPNAPTLLGPNVANAEAPIRLLWRHNPVDSSTQTQAEIRWREIGGSWSTISVGSTNNEYFDVDTGEVGWTNNNNIEWQARTWGSHPTASPWSATSLLVLSGPPVTGINSPEDGGIYISPDLVVEWSYFDPEETEQSGWEVVLLDENKEVVEERSGSGDRTSLELETVLDDGTSWEVRVRTQDGTGLFSEWDISEFSVQYPRPTPPNLDLEWQEETGTIAIQIDNPAPAEDSFERTNLVPNPRGTAAGLPLPVVDNLITNPRGQDTDGEVAVWKNLIPNPRGRITSGNVTVHRNLVPNPSFETNLDGISTGTGIGQVVQTSEGSAVYSGQSAMNIQTSGASWSNAWVSQDLEGTPVPGEWVAVSTATRRVTGGTHIRYRFIFRNADRSTITTADSAFSELPSVPNKENPRTSFAAEIPDGTQIISVVLYLTGSSGATAPADGWTNTDSWLAITAATREAAEAGVLNYFDGDTWDSDPDFTPEWEGTPHESPSRLVAPSPVGWSPRVGGITYYSQTRDCLATLYTDTTWNTLQTISNIDMQDAGDYTLLTRVIDVAGGSIQFKMQHIDSGDGGPTNIAEPGETYTWPTTSAGGTSFGWVRPVRSVGLLNVGKTIYYRAFMTPGYYTGEYFDGELPLEDPDFETVWTGEEHNSETHVNAPRPVGWSFGQGVHSLYYSQTRDCVASIFSGLVGTMSFFSIGSVQNQTVTAVAEIVDVTTPMVLATWKNQADTTPPGELVEGPTTIRHTGVATTTNSNVLGPRPINGSDFKPGETIYFRQFAATSEYVGPYFDASSFEGESETIEEGEFDIFDPDLSILWTGEPHQSISRLQADERALVWRGMGRAISPIHITDASGQDSIKVMRNPTSTDVSTIYIDPQKNFDVSEGDTVRISVEVMAHTQDMADSMRLFAQTYSGAEVEEPRSNILESPVLLGVWQTLELEFRISASPPGGYIRSLVWPTANIPPNSNSAFSIRNMIVEVGRNLPENKAYFDGASTNRSTSTGHQALFYWEGEPHGSPTQALYFPAEVAEFNEIFRSEAGGPWVRIATDVPQNGSFVDTTGPVIGQVCYRASAWSNLPSMTTGPDQCITIHNGSLPFPPGEPSSQSAWLGGGEGMALVCRAHCDIDIEEDIGPTDLVLHRFSGRTYPQLYSGVGQSQEVKLSFTAPAKSNQHQGQRVSSYEDWKRLLRSPGPHLYRDFQGRRFYVAVSPLSASRMFGDIMACSVTLTRIGE